MQFRHVDVFATRPFGGNGLVVFFGGVDLAAEELLAITAEMRQFESIFVESAEPRGGRIRARIFTVEEELPFAGHPIIGAAAAIHERLGPDDAERQWTFVVAEREIDVRSRSEGGHRFAEMDQGIATITAPLGEEESTGMLEALGLDFEDVPPGLPLQVVSTGLPYLIVPVTERGLAAAAIAVDDLEARLRAIGARFVYVLDPAGREGRTWDNFGGVEDVATGSAAGPAAAYLREHGLLEGPCIEIRQGRFVGRPSVIGVEFAEDCHLWVGGPVAAVASGSLDT